MYIEKYEPVMLLVDVENIKKGSIGTVVEIWNNGAGFEVEFLDKQGNVIDCIALTKKQIRKLTEKEKEKL